MSGFNMRAINHGEVRWMKFGMIAEIKHSTNIEIVKCRRYSQIYDLEAELY